MQHLDEHLDDGIIHALLDGELRGDELAAARAHVLACEACSARVAEERLLAGEAERLIAELDQPSAAPAGDTVPPPPESPVVKGPPVVLIPQPAEETPNRWQRRRGPGRGIGIAAMLAVAAGAGFFALQGSPGSGNFAADSVVSDMEPLPPADERAFALTDSGAAPAEPDTATLSAPTTLSAETSEGRLQESAPAARAEADAASRLADAGRPPAAEPSATPAVPVTGQAKARDEAPTRTQETQRSAAAERTAPAERDEEVASVEQTRPGVTGGSAAASSEVRPAPVAAAPAARRAAPSLEQRAEISMRIGLDEAQRLLGSPMHVIDGLQPEFVGLVPGRLVRGANPSDYVVRVVYLDEQRRLVFLDQQRLDLTGRQMGAQRDTIPPDWVKGDVRLSLSGDISSESARALARRVR